MTSYDVVYFLLTLIFMVARIIWQLILYHDKLLYLLLFDSIVIDIEFVSL